MRGFVVMALALALAGCAKSAAINFVNGKPFLLGDDNCAYYRAISPDVVQCFTSDRQPAGMRRAMSPQEFQFYLAQQQMQAQQMQELNRSIQQLGTSFAQMPQPQYTFTPPPVMPITPPGGGQVRCITAGIYTNCRY